MAERIPQSATIRVPLQAYLASDHVTPATGKTIAITISQNGGNYGNPSGGVTNAQEIGSGSYYVDLSTTDTGTLGPLFVKGTEAATDNVIAIYNVVKAHNAGFDGVPDAAANANGGLPILSVSGTTLGYTVSTLTTYTGNTPQTGDNYARIGVAGAGLTAIGDTRIANLDAAITTRATPAQILTTALTESYAALNAAPTLAQAIFEIVSILSNRSISSTTLTTQKLDGTTPAMTFALNSATAPTAQLRAS